MIKNLFKYYFSFFTLISLNVFSQELDYNIEYITTQEGLSSNYVTKVISDQFNFKWFATENGISKYNGNNNTFEYIKPGEVFNNLFNENIETIFEDRDNIIWIGTKSGGISSLDPVTYESKNYNPILGISKENAFQIFSISQDEKGRIWIGTFGNGVYVIDSNQNKLIHHFRDGENVRAIFNDSFGNVWFSSRNKLNVFNIKDESIEFFNTKQIGDIVEDVKRNKILYITAIGVLKELDLKTKKINELRKFKSQFNPTLAFDNYGKLWVGTWRYGLFVSDEKVENFKQFNLIGPNSKKLPINYSTINHIEHSKDNSTWLSIANGGVVKLTPTKPFKTLIELTSSEELVETKNIQSIFRDQDDLYIGTINSGFFKIKQNGSVRDYGFKGSKVNVINKYKDYILVGTQNALFSIDKKNIIKRVVLPVINTINATNTNNLYSNLTDRLDIATFDGNSSTQTLTTSITSVFVDSKENLWIGTQQDGLFFCKKNDFVIQKFHQIIPEKLYDNSRRITGIQEDKYGNIWVGTYNGIHLVNENKKLVSYTKLANFSIPNIINDILIDDFIWVGSSKGLYKLDYKNEENRLFLIDLIDEGKGLNQSFINSISKAESNSELGSYWISTINEVVNYNDKNKGVIHFSDQDGFNVDMFNLGAVFNYNNEKIYFGAVDDLLELDLLKISNNSSSGELIFSNLKINNELVYPNKKFDGRVVIDKNISYLKEITLNHKEATFSIGFFNNDFKEKNKYKYKIEGFQDQWIETGTRKTIPFTGLSSGKYKLIVASSIDNVNWDTSTELIINILPSPFLSTSAYFIYFVIILFSLYMIFRIYSNGLKLKSSLIEIEKDKKREMDFAESKLGFFTNISHEFRTPLTLIISPLQEILSSSTLKNEVSSKLITVEKNANKLLNLINELLDFRKADHGLLKVKVAYGNFRNFSHEIFLLFTEIAKSKNIEYNFTCDQNEINLPFDRNKMEIVISNLISNAMKFTSPGGEITVSVKSSGGFCICSVKDTGIGIPVSDVDKIFDEFFMVKSKLSKQTPGTGIGLFLSKKIVELHHGKINVLSDYGVGSEFIFSINMDPQMYREVDLNFKKSEDLSTYEFDKNVVENTDLQIDSKETILIVDDNKDIRTYLASLLSGDYNILEGENGEVGKNIAISKIPDLIISDIMMPVMDGIELCSKLKKELSTSHIPIILLTARNSTLFEVSGLESGADDYITKPFKASVVKARIKSLLENRNSTRKHLLNKVRFEPVIDPNSNEDIEISFIEKAIVLVEENIQNPNFGIEKMTDYFCMSQSTLYRKIKSLTGLSLTAFIRSVRLKKAAYLITTTETKLTYICYEVGFNDYKYFRTSFKQQFGCLPSKYKNTKVQSDVIDLNS